MRKKCFSFFVSALLIMAFSVSAFSVSAFAEGGPTPRDVIDEIEPIQYEQDTLGYYTDKETTIYSSSYHNPLNITITNHGPLTLYVRMYDPSYSSSRPIWSDIVDGGLAAGASRTYYVGSNVTKVVVIGAISPGTCSYAY